MAVLSSVPLDSLLAMPVQAAVRAQTLAGLEAQAVIAHLAQAPPFTFQVNRTTEEYDANDPSGYRQVTRAVTISVPQLALLPSPHMQLAELTSDLALEITQMQESPLAGTERPDLAGSMARLVPLTAPVPAIKLSLKIVQKVPEGVSRMTDVVTDMISGIPAKRAAAAAAGTRIEDLPGPTPPQLAALREAGILTLEMFVEAAQDPQRSAALAQALNVSERRIAIWLEEAQLSLDERPGQPQQ